MKTAELWANMSYCRRKKVGAVLAKDGRILATGFNGTVENEINFCETIEKFKNKEQLETYLKKFPKSVIDCPRCDGSGIVVWNFGPYGDREECSYCGGLGKVIYVDKTNDFTVHAEQNCITFAAKNGISTNNCDLYVTVSPCKTCAKLIIQSGIKRVIYKNLYKDEEGIKFLKNRGIKVEKF
jgi:dCMP deaminase